MLSLLATLTKKRWQLFISLGLTAAYLLLILQNVQTMSAEEKKTITYSLVSIGGIFALIGSVSFAFVIFQINYVASRKNDLFHKIKGLLFDLDKFLQDYEHLGDIISVTQELSWKFKCLDKNDFPLRDDSWQNYLDKLRPYFEEKRGIYEQDRNLENKILGYLNYLEELIFEINLMFTKEILISIVFAGVVKKVFVLLSILVLLIGISTFPFSSVLLTLLFKASPVFFGTAASLLLLELAYYLHRESEELL